MRYLAQACVPRPVLCFILPFRLLCVFEEEKSQQMFIFAKEVVGGSAAPAASVIRGALSQTLRENIHRRLAGETEPSLIPLCS